MSEPKQEPKSDLDIVIENHEAVLKGELSAEVRARKEATLADLKKRRTSETRAASKK